jgi:hypothetical protein
MVNLQTIEKLFAGARWWRATLTAMAGSAPDGGALPTTFLRP